MITEKRDLKEQLNLTKKANIYTKEELYSCLQEYTKKEIGKVKSTQGDKKLYYISAEFLLGKMLSSNLYHLGLLEEAKQLVNEMGYEWQDIQDVEKEPSLGNGGLGRLAACFLDSIASLNLCGDGIGLYYHFGLFEQKFKNLKQQEVVNTWIDESSWFTKKKLNFKVDFPSCSLQPILYDMDIIGEHGNKNTLHLFDVESVDESIVKEGIKFDKTDIASNLTLFLYPDDSDDDGRKLRIYQQYFMVCCGANMILADCKAKGFDLSSLYEHVVIQINDTHPTMIILELIRLLMAEGFHLKEAIHIVEKTCAYTNHTILAEALETWPKAYLKEVVPELLNIIEALDAIIDERNHDEHVAIIDHDNRVHMANIDIHFGKSVNGVAVIHTQILKESELHDFYKMYPEKFNNKTNGITFTRWLCCANPQLDKYLSQLLGKDYIAQNKLEKLLDYQNDESVLRKLLEIKLDNKRKWIAHMKQKQGVEIDYNAIFDTQVKRLHEYKRQQMNALYCIHKYLEIKSGKLPKRPIVCIFGAKAAPAYTIAKDIIHTLLCLEKLIQEDKEVAPYLRICFIENYNVSEAEVVIGASDISEQISLASKEASGTGNMKFMLNGALTIGTRDGANVEIEELVGDENIYMFGENSDQVIEHYENMDYCSKTIYKEDEHIQEIVDFIISDAMLEIGDKESLTRLYEELLNKDWFMTLLDVQDYIRCKESMLQDYEDRLSWARKMLVNIAKSGFFSSDRTIQEYDHDIWKLA